MTSTQAPALLVTRQQTRFYITEDDASKEIDVKGLNIVIPTEGSSANDGSRSKTKSSGKKEGVEILAAADLRLKAGTHYAMLGRNGTGKSTILRAFAEHMIPGIPLSIRISILQQTAPGEELEAGSKLTATSTVLDKTVLQQVVEGDTVRNEIVHELEVLSKGIDSTDVLSPIRALRKIRHKRLEKEFREVEKDANLRSGARGWDARKVLIAYEKKMEDSKALLDQDGSEIDNETIERENKAAVDLQAELQAQLDTMQLADVEARARTVLIGLGFKEPQLAKPFSTLSGGWRMRCLLAAALTHTADIIVLDEPTNFLDLLGIIWLQRYLISLHDSPTTLLLVSHDRDFVDAICDEVIILRDQKLVYFAGNLSAYEKDVRHRILRMTRMKEAQDKQVAHIEKTIQSSIKIGKKTGDDNKLRQAKSRQKKVDDRMGLQVSATGGRFKLNRDLPGYYETGKRAAIEIPEEERSVAMTLPSAPDLRFPGSLVSLENVSFSYPRTAKPVLNDINLVIHTGDRVGIVGLNGSGKSTLIKLLVDEAKPSKGTAARHARLRIGYYSQHAVEDLQTQGLAEPSLTALSLLLRDADGTMKEPEARGLLGSMGLPGRTASDVPVCKLSGGQRVRLALCLLLHNPPHLLVLDEPTTHLDFHTVKALCRALSEWNGAVVLVSHDRFLMRCVVGGEPVDPEDSEDEGDEDDDDGGGTGLKRRRVIYELKLGKLVERSDVDAWEASLEARLKKLAL